MASNDFPRSTPPANSVVLSDRLKKYASVDLLKQDFGAEIIPYKQVEYLESTGTQWIDTGITPQSTDTTAFIFTQSYSAFQNERLVWGSNLGANQGADIQHYYICGRDVSSVQMQVGEIYNCETRVLPNKIVQGFINGEMFRNNQGSDPYLNPFYVFNLGGYGQMFIRYLRIHELKVVVNGTSIRNFIPVLFTNEKGESEGALYDKVSRQLFRNANTDPSAEPFIIGPDLN